MIHTQHQESKPTTTLMFSPLKSVPSSLNAYTGHKTQEQNMRIIALLEERLPIDSATGRPCANTGSTG